MLHTIAHYALYVTGGCTILAVIGLILVAAAALDLHRKGEKLEGWEILAVVVFLVAFWGGATYGLTLL